MKNYSSELNMSLKVEYNVKTKWIVDKIDGHRWNKHKKCWMFNTSFEQCRYDLTDSIIREKVNIFKKNKEIFDSYLTKDRKVIYIKFKNKWLYEHDFINDIIITKYKKINNLN